MAHNLNAISKDVSLQVSSGIGNVTYTKNQIYKSSALDFTLNVMRTWGRIYDSMDNYPWHPG